MTHTEPSFQRADRVHPERQAVFGSLTVAENLELAARSRGFGPALEAYPELRPLLLGELDACVVVAEQRLPPGLRTRAGVVVCELRRGAVVFAGEAAELS